MNESYREAVQRIRKMRRELFLKKERIRKRLGASHGFKCAICSLRFVSEKKLGIDHDHFTGAFRGLLCSNCNAGLGMFKDNIRLLANAILYLEDNGHSFSGDTELLEKIRNGVLTPVKNSSLESVLKRQRYHLRGRRVSNLKLPD